MRGDNNIAGRYHGLKERVKCKRLVLEWIYIGDIEYILNHLCVPSEELHIVVW